jgi:hypothetical protein
MELGPRHEDGDGALLMPGDPIVFHRPDRQPESCSRQRW